MQTDEQREAEIERRAQQRIAAAIADLRPMIEGATETAVRKVLADTPIRVSVDWEQGYKEMEKHAGTSMAEAIGKRIINWLFAAILAGAVAWAVFSGRIK